MLSDWGSSEAMLSKFEGPTKSCCQSLKVPENHALRIWGFQETTLTESEDSRKPGYQVSEGSKQTMLSESEGPKKPSCQNVHHSPPPPPWGFILIGIAIPVTPTFSKWPVLPLSVPLSVWTSFRYILTVVLFCSLCHVNMFDNRLVQGGYFWCGAKVCCVTSGASYAGHISTDIIHIHKVDHST